MTMISSDFTEPCGVVLLLIYKCGKLGLREVEGFAHHHTAETEEEAGSSVSHSWLLACFSMTPSQQAYDELSL